MTPEYSILAYCGFWFYLLAILWLIGKHAQIRAPWRAVSVTKENWDGIVNLVREIAVGMVLIIIAYRMSW